MYKTQLVGTFLDVSDWEEEEEFAPFPVGARTKTLLKSGTSSSWNFILPAHRYLFKFSNRRYPAQYWAEIAAYRIGTLMQVPVPPAFAAKRNGEEAALIEWFYGPNFPAQEDKEPARETVSPLRFWARWSLRKIFGAANQPEGGTHTKYVAGSSYMVRLVKDYDLKKGKQHNVHDILKLGRNFRRAYGGPSPEEHWAKVFAFDAVIGNTDRHQDNWGVLWRGEAAKLRPCFSPAFDNGTALGHEITEEQLDEFTNPDRLSAYVNRGQHHVKWTSSAERRCGHVELISRLCGQNAQLKRVIASALDFNDGDLEDAIRSLTVDRRAIRTPFPG